MYLGSDILEFNNILRDAIRTRSNYLDYYRQKLQDFNKDMYIIDRTNCMQFLELFRNMHFSN